ncbi:LysR family transcriptional regulator [Sphingobium xenophagum]
MIERHLPPFAALRAFEAVGRLGGIRRAAEAMGVSHAIVSRHLSSLEELFGVQLFNRKTGHLTEIGLGYHQRISAAIAEISAASAALAGVRSGGLTIWSSAGFSVQWLARHLSAFGQARNRPIVDLRASDREPNFAAGEADGDVRYQYDWSPSPPHDVRAEELARPAVFPVVSPGFARTIAAPAEVIQLPLIQESSEREWRQWLMAQNFEVGDLGAPIARYGQAHLCLAAARAGQGVALANWMLAAEDLNEGRLIRLEPTSQPFSIASLGAYEFRCLRIRWRDPLLSRFRDWLHRSIGKELTDRRATPQTA